MKKIFKYISIIIILAIIALIPNISKAISKSEINSHVWGSLYPDASFWKNDDYNSFYNYIISRFPNITPDFFKNPLTSPAHYHAPTGNSCAICAGWRTEGGDFLYNLLNSGTKGINKTPFPLIGNIVQGRAGVNYYIYCMEHGAAFGDEHWLIYDNMLYMHIDGNYLTQITRDGQTTYPNFLSTANGRLAFLAYATPDNGFNGTDSNGDRLYGGYGLLHIVNNQTVGYTLSQRTYWPFINQWYSDVGQYVGVDYTDKKNNDYSYNLDLNSNSLYKQANDYANNIGTLTSTSDANGTDKTNVNNIKIEDETRNSEQWVKVGPFNWEFKGNLSSVTVTGNTGNISDFLILNSDGSTQIQANQIKSGSNFYITVKTNAELTSITKVSGKVTLPDIITADIYVIKGDSTKIYSQMVLNLNSNYSANRLFQKLMLIKPNLVKKEGTVETSVEGGIPITITFSIEKVDEDDNTIKLPGVGFKFYNNEAKKYIKSDGTTYEYVDTEEEATEFITDDNGKIEIKNVPSGTYLVYETKISDRAYAVNEDPVQIEPTNGANIVISNKIKFISFVVGKIDKDNPETKLVGVGFKFYNVDANKYLKLNGDEFEYVDTIEEATEFVTDEDGKIQLSYAPVGTYLAYETKNPNYGYVVNDEPVEFKPEEGETIEVTNAIEYIKITGKVWEDIQSEKMSKRNDLYKLDENDNQDILMEGVKVSLKDKTTGDLVDDTMEGLNSDQKVVAETYTDENGEYQFEYVPIDNLENYYVEFEYDGLIYENVVPHLENEEKGSKALEPEREEFNNRFNFMENGGDYITIADQNGQEEGRPIVNYTRDEENSGEYGTTLKMESTENTEIIARTDEAGYELEYTEGSGITEITNINLGLYRRSQADLAIQTELEEIKAEINGYGHIYRYGPRYDVNNEQQVEDSWNLGIRYENTYKGTYERPIYKADAAYEHDNNEDSSEELSLALTYKITVRNQGSIFGKVNEIIAYFDSRYDKITAVGTKMDNEGNVVGTQLTGTIDESYNENNGYNRVVIDTAVLNEIISHTGAENEGENVTQQSIYVQFNLPREVILEMLNEEEVDNTLSFTAEIGSYTSYSDAEGKNLYAAYDVDSVPDNATAGDFETYEDDTDRASEVAITLAEAREISGYVFEDTKEDSEENVAEGNGEQDDGEYRLRNVKVQLVDSEQNIVQVLDENEDDEEWMDAEYDVNTETGMYKISGFIPGEYQVRFVWGAERIGADGTERIKTPEESDDPIIVENYKSTIISYDKYERYQELAEEGNEGRFYKDEGIVDGSSMALDDYSIRQQIDNYLLTYKHDTFSEITEMKSNTWTMEFPVEYDVDELINTTLEATNAKNDTNTDGKENGHKITFPVSDINFGIIRRPEQNIELTKRVSRFKFTLPTGQVLIDAEIDEEGNIKGAKNYLAYVEGSSLRAEIDENLLQGATIEIDYKLKVRNTSESDYSNEGYYNYGERYYEENEKADKAKDIITFTPTLIIDYLDESAQFDKNVNVNIKYKWENTTINDLTASKRLDEKVLTELKGTRLENYQLYLTKYCDEENIILKPVFYIKGEEVSDSGNSAELSMSTGQPVGAGRGVNYHNQAEIIEIKKTGGGKLTSTPGNYVPDRTSATTPDTDDATSEKIIVLPNTGGNRNYVLPISLILIAFMTLGVGIYTIKIKVLGKK